MPAKSRPPAKAFGDGERLPALPGSDRIDDRNVDPLPGKAGLRALVGASLLANVPEQRRGKHCANKKPRTPWPPKPATMITP